MKINITLEFDENNLGPKWMNSDNLALLLYGKHSTKPELLKVISYTEATSDRTAVELATAITMFDDTKVCHFDCGKIEWGEDKHDKDCPFRMAYDIKNRAVV
jgi:hypothetical protein